MLGSFCSLLKKDDSNMFTRFISPNVSAENTYPDRADIKMATTEITGFKLFSRWSRFSNKSNDNPGNIQRK